MEPNDVDPGLPSEAAEPDPSDSTGQADETGARPAHASGEVEQISEPAKLLRVIDTTRQLLAEIQHDGLDVPARQRVRTSYREALRQVRGLLPPTDRQELDQLLGPLETGAASAEVEEVPSTTHLRLAEAQLLGWLDGLLKGLEAEGAARQVQAEADQASETGRPQRQHQQWLPQPTEGGAYR